MSLILAIDIGTSSAKAALFEAETGTLLDAQGFEYATLKPKPGYAEQDPDGWWLAAVLAARQVMRDTGRHDVAAIGLTGQMHGVTLVDSAGEPVCPSIIWADQRSAPHVERVIDFFGEDLYTSITGTMPAAGFMVTTLHWMKENQPELLRSAQRVMLPKDFIRLKLTGNIGTDVSDAAATGLFDVTQRTWSARIIDTLQLPSGIFPQVNESAQVIGTLISEAADILGIKPGIPVVAGCADQPAQALANGMIDPGVASVTTGTGGQVCFPLTVAPGQPVPTDRRVHVFNHAVPGRWYILGAILSAGMSLRWLRGITGLADNPNAYAIFSAEAAKVPPGADGLIFLPYLVGERTPHMDAQARGGFIGLSDYHTRGHLARAVMEGVTFALRQTLEICMELGGNVDSLVVSGGGAESDVWRQIQADVFGLPLQKSPLKEQTCIGAALLAGVGAGIYRDIREACASVSYTGGITEPNAENHARYNDIYEQFTGLYPLLRDDLHRLSGG